MDNYHSNKVKNVLKESDLDKKFNKTEGLVRKKVLQKEIKHSYRKELNKEVSKKLDTQLNYLDDLFLEQDIPEGNSKVYLLLDISGSMEKQYSNGNIDNFLNRLMALSLKIDYQKEINFWLYSSDFQKLPNITENNFYNYKENYIYSENSDYSATQDSFYNKFINKTDINIFNGTNTTDVSQNLEKTLKEDKKNNVHPLVIYLMDEDINFSLIEEIVQRNSNTFFKFMSLENSWNSSSINSLSKYENVDYITEIKGKQIKENEIYELITRKYFDWFKKISAIEDLEKVKILKDFIMKWKKNPDNKDDLLVETKKIISESNLSNDKKIELYTKIDEIASKGKIAISKFLKILGGYNNETKELISKSEVKIKPLSHKIETKSEIKENFENSNFFKI